MPRARPAARLYGAPDAPRSDAERQILFEAMDRRLEPSPIVFEFLEIMRAAPILPRPLRRLQPLLIRAAVEITPVRVRERLGLGTSLGLGSWQLKVVRRLGALADRMVLRRSPAVQSCRRLGLPGDYLYRRRGTDEPDDLRHQELRHDEEGPRLARQGGQPYAFHDYKAAGIDRARLEAGPARSAGRRCSTGPARPSASCRRPTRPA
jgi:hypothetical protein